jgi:glycerophosphoryl diester phosphodiesterase
VRSIVVTAAVLALGAAPGPAAAQAAAPPTAEPPLVIAHRGASGYRPEHTLAAYRLAIEMGADCVEPDLVMTRDGALVARHEPEIGATTDVAAKFPERKTKKPVDGREVEGWFTDDFTLAEIKTLRAKQPRDDRASAWDGLYEVPTLQEVIDLARRGGEARGRPVCVYPETKHPTYYAERGLDIDAALVGVLDANGLTGPEAPVIVQSFEVGNLKRLAGMTRVRLVQLFGEPGARPYDFVGSGDPRTYKDLMAPAALEEIAGYAFGIGPWKRTIVGEGAGGALEPASTLVRDAHAAGLRVHPYTFRDEPRHLAGEYGGDPVAEYLQFYRLGVDGVFSDFPDTALRARAALGGG